MPAGVTSKESERRRINNLDGCALTFKTSTEQKIGEECAMIFRRRARRSGLRSRPRLSPCIASSKLMLNVVFMLIQILVPPSAPSFFFLSLGPAHRMTRPQKGRKDT